MFIKLFSFIEKRKKNSKIKKVAKFANEELYSEKYSLNEEIEREKFINKIIKTIHPFDLLLAYKTINYTLYNQLPINENDLLIINNMLIDLEKKFEPNKSKLDKLEKEKAKYNLKIKFNKKDLKLINLYEEFLKNNLEMEKILIASDLNKLEYKKNYIELEKSKLKANLMINHIYLEEGKKAFIENKYSYRGALYRLEKASKGHSTLEIREELKLQTDKII